jgi:hypothetical protein
VDGFTSSFTADAIQAGNICARLSKRNRHTLTKSLPCAGDERDFAIEFK